ncbi:ribonuclease H-like domain-containing protein [Tanacetum coccineum]
MDLETAQTTTTAKLPILKQGEYDMWRLRIEQYFQVQDYALWDVIENGNSFKPAAQTTTNADGTSTSLIPGPVTTKEKVQKKNDVKARSMLLMALPNEHLMIFNQYKDAKTLFVTIQTRFGGNEATKKNQKTLLKLQKIISQLAILGKNISQEDLNLKFLRSLPSEWNTYVVVWRNKPDLDTMSFDDLYNNFKIVEQEVKRTKSSNSSSSSQNMAFVSSPSSTNEVNTAYKVSTANTQVSPVCTQVSTASTQVSIANLSDATVYAFLASQQNGSQLVCEDLEQIHEDDLEEMDLKWQLALLSMRIGRGPRNQDSRNMNQDNSRRTINVEETSSKAMVAIDGSGFDWIYMVDDEVPTNMALMAFLNSKVYNDKTCSKTYLKGFEALKTQLDDLRIEFNKYEFNLATYKRGLASVEDQLVFYKKNEVIFYEQLVVLKKDISYKDSEISMLKSELEKFKQEKESNQLKIEKFDNASKSLDKLIRIQITDKSRKGVGFVSYNAVPPPHTRLFSPLKLDLSNSGLEEFQQPEFEGYKPKTSKSVSEYISNEVRESPHAPLVEELVSDDKSQNPRGNQRNWNNQKSQQLGSDFMMYNKACFVCRSFDHVQDDYNYHQRERVGHLQKEDQGYVDSGCSRYMTGNMSYLLDFKEFDERYVTFGRGAKGEKITGKGILKTSKINFEDVYFVKELQFNLFSVSQMCNKKNSVLFTDTGCFVLSPYFKLADESQVLLKVPRKNNMYSVDMKNIVSKESLTCLNRVLVVKKPQNKTSYEQFKVETPTLSFMRPFGCHVTILNTLDYLGKFDGKSDEGFFVGYSLNSKAFRVYNIRTRKVEENLHFMFLKDKSIIAGDGPKWLFDIDVLTKSMNYMPVVVGTNSNDFVGTEESIGAGHSSKETGSIKDYILMPLWKDGSLFDSSSKNASNDEPQPSSDAGKKDDEGVSKESGIDDQERPENSTQYVNTTRPSINTASTNVNTGSLNINTVSLTVTTARLNGSQTEPDMFSLGDNATLKATHADFFGDEIEVDTSNITTTYLVLSTPNTRIHKDHSLDHVIGDVWSGVQTRRMTKTTNEQGFISAVYNGKTHKDLHTYLNKQDKRGIVIRNKARLVTQGHTQEEGINYDEVFSPIARIKAIRLFLAYASFMGFMVYQMDVKSNFLYGRIEEEKELCTEFEKLMHDKFQMSFMGELTFFLGLQVKQKEDGIFISQDKYVADILRKFSFTDVRTYVHVPDSKSHLSDYARASLDRKSTTRGCQFLGCRLISWQCKKQTMVATSSTEAEYVATTSCCGQVSVLGYKYWNAKSISKVVWLDLVIAIVEFVRGKAAD